jgi:hypothetical protein
LMCSSGTWLVFWTGVGVFSFASVICGAISWESDMLESRSLCWFFFFYINILKGIGYIFF